MTQLIKLSIGVNVRLNGLLVYMSALQDSGNLCRVWPDLAYSQLAPEQDKR